MHSWPDVALPTLPGALSTRLLIQPPKKSDRSRPVPPPDVRGGITPYDATHLGHAATYLAFDLINRQWRDNGSPSPYVQNVTDIDDPRCWKGRCHLCRLARLATSQIQLFRDDMTALRVIPPRNSSE